MAESRPSMQSVQRSLIMGIVLGLIFGCLIGGAAGLYYAWMMNPAVYADGAYPNDLAPGYQSHYFDMVVDSYIVNRQASYAQNRLQSFSDAQVITALGERSVAFVANGQAVEAQANPPETFQEITTMPVKTATPITMSTIIQKVLFSNILGC